MKMHPYVEALVIRLGGKEVEIYLGDSKSTLKLAEFDHALKSIIRGKILEGIGDCLVLEVDNTPIYINSWAIKLVIPMSSSLFVKDVFVDEHKGFNKKKNKK